MTEAMLSQDSLAIVLLCSHLGAPRKADLAPLTEAEWDALAERIANSPIKSPSGLFGQDCDSLRNDLAIDAALADRIARLLARSGPIAFELERLASLGIWILTRADPQYPRELRRRLRSRTPSLFYGLGERGALTAPGVAVVGSRDLDDSSMLFASATGRAAAKVDLTVFSGASRGADLTAMKGALDSSGRAVGVLADSLERSLRDPATRDYISAGALTLLSSFHPSAPFRAGNAMARNKIIYCLSLFAVVVASTDGKGGTWAGANEVLKQRWVPLYVRATDDAPPGNRHLVKLGAQPIPTEAVADSEALARWFVSLQAANANGSGGSQSPQPEQRELFDLVWDLMTEFLSTPRTTAEIASHFRLIPEQAALWLAVAESRGLAHQRPTGWVTGRGASADQGSLFERL